MPEIPDLEAIREFLEPRILGQPIESTEVRYPWLIRSEDGLVSLESHAFVALRRYGKFLIFTTDDERLLVINPMLTGRFHWAEAKEKRRPGTCVVIAFPDGHQLRYSDARRMGRWYIVPIDALNTVPQFEDIGPDALEVDEATFLQRLKKHRGQAKPALTNQRFIAGIGNAYSDEVLWEARIHPHRRMSTLSDDERHGLYVALRTTLEWAMPILRAEVAERLYQSNEEWRDHLRVHRKGGQPCPRCGSEIRSQVSGSRETNYCLTCQPLPL
jgi:formamidopyrimidine-DNA glycosylase